MTWWSDDRVTAVAAGLLVAGLAAAAILLRRGARRRQARRWAAWRRDHARRLPWELFRRRGASLRLTDQRAPRAPDARRRREL